MAMNFANQLKDERINVSFLNDTSSLKAFFNYYFVNYLTIKTLINIISNK